VRNNHKYRNTGEALWIYGGIFASANHIPIWMLRENMTNENCARLELRWEGRPYNAGVTCEKLAGLKA
jgi:hypothetical protein